MGFPCGSDSKESPCNAEDLGWEGVGHGNLLQYSCLENPVDRGAWQAAVHGVTKSWTGLSDKAQHTSISFGGHKSWIAKSFSLSQDKIPLFDHTFCYGLKYVPTKFYIEAQMPSVMIFGDGVFGRR